MTSFQTSNKAWNDYRKGIRGIVTGFGTIKAWTKNEQKRAIKNQEFKDGIYEKSMEKISHF